ncbi:type II secretion system minor pseudopilin GspI [Pseudomonas sp. NFIX28]|uniref:type II secretion system minor pseudopilin GspI n=1 Tax=Pseudomonas sp. NFIX28 TaxID=1566235 RepID=UPI0008952ABE|nr:type II secretion system minor pseudopilin GspI [Pseudomonas sp. NFIX28]SDZ62611.1 general secretion pathway protein I [Pseudomonas sp. NFIX28]
MPRSPQPAFKPASRTQRGFTLIEVLVALAIIAVAMSAAVRVAGLMTQSNGLLRDKSIALLAAQTRLAELRLVGRLPPGAKNIECDQGRLKLRCEQNIGPSTDPRLAKVSVLVLDRSREAPPLARLDTLIARTPKNPNR